METGDGLILRLVPQDGVLSPEQLRGLAAAARAFGSGMMEVTARGSLQVRGLTPETVGLLQEAVLALGIVPRLGLPVDVSPLSGLDPAERADARPLAARIGAAATVLAADLGPKVSVVIDGGGAIRLDGRKADIRLEAAGAGTWSVSIDGGAPETADADTACARTLEALAAIAARGRGARATDLVAERRPGRIGTGTLLPPEPGAEAPAAPPSPPTPGGIATASRAAVPRQDLPGRATTAPIGRFPLADGNCAFGIGLPFGAGPAALIEAIAEVAEAAGARDLRPAPERVLLVTGLAPEAATDLAARAEALGLIVAAGDPRAAVAACPGAPACASAHFPARAMAAEVAHMLAPLLDPSVSVHLSACAKGCARPAPATLTFVGIDAGIALVHEGRAMEAAPPAIPTSLLPARLAALAAAFAAAARLHPPGARGRDILRRLDLPALWAAGTAPEPDDADVRSRAP